MVGAKQKGLAAGEAITFIYGGDEQLGNSE